METAGVYRNIPQYKCQVHQIRFNGFKKNNITHTGCFCKAYPSSFCTRHYENYENF